MKTQPGWMKTLDLSFSKIQLTSFARDAKGAVVFSSQQCWDTIKNVSNCAL